MAVCVYLLASVAAVLLPAFVPDVVDRTLIVVWNMLLLAFVGGLMVVFRMREGNQYLTLTDDPAGGGQLLLRLSFLSFFYYIYFCLLCSISFSTFYAAAVLFSTALSAIVMERWVFFYIYKVTKWCSN
jgi:hypothetical protein